MKQAAYLSALFCALMMSFISKPVQAQQPVGTGAYSICVVSHDASNTYFASKLSTGGSAADGEVQYKQFRESLIKAGKANASDAGNCYFNDDSERLQNYVHHLADGCDNCAKWTIVDTDWTPGIPKSDLPKEIAADLEHTVAVPFNGKLGVSGFITFRYRYYLCDGDEIRVSYGLLINPKVPNITELSFGGIAFGMHGGPHFTDPKARPVNGTLGCAAQGVKVASLADHRSELIQHQTTDGKDVWSETDMIRHFLGGLSVQPDPATVP